MNILLIFGGPSAEHEISLLSARFLFDSIEKKRHQVTLVGISKSGSWVLYDEERLKTEQQVASVDSNCDLQQTSRGPVLNSSNAQQPVDVAIPCLHGPFGEDGTIQGLFEIYGIPYVGSDVLSSALCMDKIAMKTVVLANQIKTARFIAIDRWSPAPDFETVQNQLGLPFFIKPANMGSSVGCHKVKSATDYLPAVQDALKYDSRVVIEEFINGRELEVAVFDTGTNLIVSDVGEVITHHEFYSYEAKYLDEQGATTQVPAELDDETRSKIKKSAEQIFKLFNCRHLARVDFFLTDSGELFLNEPNTFPGCAPISLYPVLLKREGIDGCKMIETFLRLATSDRSKKQNQPDECPVR